MAPILDEIDRLRELFITKTGGLEPNRLNVPRGRLLEFTRVAYGTSEALAANNRSVYRGMLCQVNGTVIDVLRIVGISP